VYPYSGVIAVGVGVDTNQSESATTCLTCATPTAFILGEAPLITCTHLVGWVTLP
jgi:hypothetical protein